MENIEYRDTVSFDVIKKLICATKWLIVDIQRGNAYIMVTMVVTEPSEKEYYYLRQVVFVVLKTHQSFSKFTSLKHGVHEFVDIGLQDQGEPNNMFSYLVPQY